MQLGTGTGVHLALRKTAGRSSCGPNLFVDVLTIVQKVGDMDLIRLCLEYASHMWRVCNNQAADKIIVNIIFYEIEMRYKIYM